MDHNRFDRLSQTLADPILQSRRGVLALLGAAAGCLLLDDGESAAKRKRQGRQASHRPGKGKDNRKGKRKGNGPSPNDQAACEKVLRAAGCTQGSDGLSIVWSCPLDTNLEGANLSNCNLIGARLNGVRLTKAILNGSILNNALLIGATLHEAQLNHADLVEVRAWEADFGGVKHWAAADLRRGDFAAASFNSCIFDNTKLQGAIFDDADLRGVGWSSATCPDGHLAFFPGETCCGHLNGHTTPNCS